MESEPHVRPITAAIAFLVISADIASADLVASWNFGTSTPVASPAVSGPISGFTIGDFSIGNSLGTVTAPINTTSPSGSYSGASGGENIGNAQRTGALVTGSSGSGYFSFTVTNNSGSVVQLTDYDFGIRSTGTGSTSYTLRSSADSFASDVFTGTLAANSAWSLKNNSFSAYNIPSNNTPIELRLYGYNGTGSPGSGTQNTRIDDVTATFVAVAAVPEPTAFLFGGLVCGVIGLAAGAKKLGRKSQKQDAA